MSRQLEKTYNPKEIEPKLYEKWCENKYFHAEVDRSRKPFTTVMPPPNITGKLHMGHALDNTLQDILIRYKRMQGYNALWIPGTDHAAISTEVKVTNKLKEEGIDKRDLGREGFLKRTWEWKEEYAGTIEDQLKKLGVSCDWDRERFTMDEGCSRAVEEVFVRLYEKGYIYKGSRIINWCPVCQTSLSDAEVEHEEQAGHFWHISYPIVGTDRSLVIATTRPETMLGDTAIVVNPEDERYTDIIGKKALLPLVNKEIPIIADSYVDKEFGTGAMKVTPAHDPNDFEIGKRHGLEEINIMNDDATINENGGKYAGMDRYEAREAIVKDLQEQGYLVKVEDYAHNVGVHERCKHTVEPLIKQQWFVKMEELAKPAIKALETGELKLIPERMNKIYLQWLNNIRDWCVSRQIWWGHRIPAYYCDECGEMVVAKGGAPEKCPKCGCTHFTQDEDTLDTWFSSALWPFSTLGWPDQTEDLDYFYPTDVLVTGYDIIFFWVIRMVFSGFEQTGKCPFHTVFFHGLIRDDQGRKMSKSLGNGIDPLEIIDQYGADALRLTVVTGNAPGNDMRFYIEKVEANRNFANKVWNASRFILMNMEDKVISRPDESDLAVADKWILSKMNRLVKDVTENMDKFELGIAVQKVYDFIWDEFCDWYIELAKYRIYHTDENYKAANAALWTLKTVLGDALKLLHPYMPFVTEEIYSALAPSEESLMMSSWPEYNESCEYFQEEDIVDHIKDIVRGVRESVHRERAFSSVRNIFRYVFIRDIGAMFFTRYGLFVMAGLLLVVIFTKNVKQLFKSPNFAWIPVIVVLSMLFILYASILKMPRYYYPLMPMFALIVPHIISAVPKSWNGYFEILLCLYFPIIVVLYPIRENYRWAQLKHELDHPVTFYKLNPNEVVQLIPCTGDGHTYRINNAEAIDISTVNDTYIVTKKEIGMNNDSIRSGRKLVWGRNIYQYKFTYLKNKHEKK